VRRICGAILIALLLFAVNTETARSEYLQSDINYAPNAIVIVISNEYQPIFPTIANGIAITGISAVDELNQKYGVSDIWQLFPKATENGAPEMEGYYSLTIDENNDLETVLTDYDDLNEIDHVEGVAVHKLDFLPNDPYRSTQWALSKVNAYNAWNLTQGDVSVVLGIADSGVDWDHPDLNDDIWTNSAEINGTAGYDDDGNGYVDDYRGWDWVTGVTGAPGEDDQTPDNNPMDFAGHGTHVGGIASAETNNGTGIAGLGFDCLIMALRIGWLDINGWSYVRMDFASSAFYYATNKDVKSINCSWGSSYSSAFASAANYAKNNGVVVVSSAGNSNNSTASYLCSRSEVIAVAATDNTDHKASFSNYGSWVDVSAPGVNIRSTYYNNTILH
jgi:subtilisin family serine protease